MIRPGRAVWACALTAAALLRVPGPGNPGAMADDRPRAAGGAVLSPGRTFSEATGESLYTNVCQGCHMSDGRGAVGAGAYPALVADPRLEDVGFPVRVVVDGLRAMPAFGQAMSDVQVIAVVTYIRTHFDNRYDGEVTAGEVEAARR